MKIEKKNNEKLNTKRKDSFINVFRELKIGECVRLSTAREALKLQGSRHILKKERIIISSKLDGEDLLVFKTTK